MGPEPFNASTRLAWLWSSRLGSGHPGDGSKGPRTPRGRQATRPSLQLAPNETAATCRASGVHRCRAGAYATATRLRHPLLKPQQAPRGDQRGYVCAQAAAPCATCRYAACHVWAPRQLTAPETNLPGRQAGPRPRRRADARALMTRGAAGGTGPAGRRVQGGPRGGAAGLVWRAGRLRMDPLSTGLARVA